MSDRTFSFLLHGGSKKGKTRLAATAPKPMLILDAEGGSRFLNRPLAGQTTAWRVIEWDVAQYAPPIYDGTWDICVVYVRNYQTMLSAYAWLDSGQHPFESVVVDSLSEVQQRCIDGLVGSNPMKTQDWGTLLRELSGLVRKLRDLTFHQTRPIQCIVLIAMSKQQEGRWTAFAQGQLQTALPYYIDAIGYLDVLLMDDGTGTGQTAPKRVLLLSPMPQYEAGDRTGQLPSYIVDPDIEQMINTIHGPVPQPEGAASG